jgi:hypothetical protein
LPGAIFDETKRAVPALHISKITAHHGHYLRLHPYGHAYARLINPDDVVDPGQRTVFLTLFTT